MDVSSGLIFLTHTYTHTHTHERPLEKLILSFIMNIKDVLSKGHSSFLNSLFTSKSCHPSCLLLKKICLLEFRIPETGFYSFLDPSYIIPNSEKNNTIQKR